MYCNYLCITILSSSLYTAPASTVNDLAVQYNDVLSSILDSHAPKQTKSFVIRNHSPWYNEDIKKAKQARRQAERRWRKSKLSVHLEIFRNCQHKVTKLCSEAKSNYLCNKINENAGNQKELFRIGNDLLCKNKSPLTQTVRN